MGVLDRCFAAGYDLAGPLLERGRLGELRADLLAHAEGHVLELGAGVGASLPHLLAPDAEVARITLTEPSAPMVRRLCRRLDAGRPHAPAAPRPAPRDDGGPAVQVLRAPAEALPLPDGSVDVVVSALVLCTVADVGQALREVRRVLHPGGRLLLLEHVRADGALGLVQRAVDPAWRILGRGCRLTRDTRDAVAAAGFDVSAVVDRRLASAGPAGTLVVGPARRE